LVVIDTNIIIRRVKNEEKIPENITEISIIEYPPILSYENFEGKVYLIERRDIIKSIELQKKLRRIGLPKGVADLLIAAICINRKEKLLTTDKDFLDIAEISELNVELLDE